MKSVPFIATVAGKFKIGGNVAADHHTDEEDKHPDDKAADRADKELRNESREA